ncbi:MAG: hypothetical protein AAGF96_06130 [Bacteroidota bacterium]
MEKKEQFDLPQKKKVTKRTVVQRVNGKTILHHKPFRHSGSSVEFMARHGIRPGTVIANGFRVPKGMALKAEKNKINRGISMLSRAQRELVMKA